MSNPRINVRETGLQIYKMMDANKITVKDIQKRCRLATVQGVYKWLNGKNLPTLDNLVILADVFGTTVDSILVVERKEVEDVRSD